MENESKGFIRDVILFGSKNSFHIFLGMCSWVNIIGMIFVIIDIIKRLYL